MKVKSKSGSLLESFPGASLRAGRTWYPLFGIEKVEGRWHSRTRFQSIEGVRKNLILIPWIK